MAVVGDDGQVAVEARVEPNVVVAFEDGAFVDLGEAVPGGANIWVQPVGHVDLRVEVQ